MFYKRQISALTIDVPDGFPLTARFLAARIMWIKSVRRGMLDTALEGHSGQ
jgi:hypothetical protein